MAWVGIASTSLERWFRNDVTGLGIHCVGDDVDEKDISNFEFRISDCFWDVLFPQNAYDCLNFKTISINPDWKVPSQKPDKKGIIG